MQETYERCPIKQRAQWTLMLHPMLHSIQVLHHPLVIALILELKE